MRPGVGSISRGQEVLVWCPMVLDAPISRHRLAAGIL
jgi:hypothetical protein